MNESAKDRIMARAASLCALGAGAVALGGLVSWPLELWRQTTFGPDFVPMAPSTALLVLLLSVAAFLRARGTDSRAGLRVERGCILLALGAALFFESQHIFGFTVPVELWLSQTNEFVANTPAGRMSPWTAICIAGTAMALLGGGVTSPRWRWLRLPGSGAALAVFAVCGIHVAAYALATPLFYGGGSIPMALLTAVALLFLSASVLLGAGSNAWPLHMLFRADAVETPRSWPRLEWTLIFLFGFTAAGITLVGFRHLHQRQAEARRAARIELEAIAGLKVRQIVNWRQERLSDVHLLRDTPYVARRALDAMVKPNSPTTRAMFTGFLRPLLTVGSFESVLLADADLNVRLIHPKGNLPEMPDEVRQAAEQALTNRQVAVTDLYQSPGGEHVHMNFVVPLVVRRNGTNDTVLPAGTSPSAADRSAGVLILQINAHDFLFPLLQIWPTPRRTAETLLVRRDGDDVLYLNELRYQKGRALSLRQALTNTHLPAVMALRKQVDSGEGTDYRNTPVVFASRRVPGTPWAMVAKVDREEIYAPLHQEALIVFGMTLALLLAAGFGITALWHRRSQRFLQTQLTAEQERRALGERFEHLMRNAHDIVLLGDSQGRILEANERAVQTFGWTPDELQQMNLAQLHAPESRVMLARQDELLHECRHASFETVQQRKDGTTFPAEVSASQIEIGGVSCKLAIVRDITQRKAHEAEIGRLTRLYATLSHVNQTIVRSQTREELLEEICQVAINIGGFSAAWIGSQRPGETGCTTHAHCATKPDAGRIMPGWNGHCGIIAEALRTGRACLGNDSQTDERAACCQKELAVLGVKSCAAFPLRLRGEVWGAFSICSTDSTHFCPEECRLLDEVSDDISLALDRLDQEEQRATTKEALRRSEEIVRENEERLRLALSSANQGLWDLNVQTGEAIVSPEYARMLGYEPEELRETNAAWRERLHPDDREVASRAYEEYIAGRRAEYRVEFRQRTRSNDWKWILSTGKLVARDAGGRPLRLLGMHTDITERKEAELAAGEAVTRLAASRQALLSVVEDHQEAEKALRASLGVQTELLKEVHHRVKNNLQIMVSLLSLQARQVKNDVALETLHDTQRRIRSLALLHETLHRQGNAARADATIYFGNLCDHLCESFGSGARRIRLDRRLATVDLDLDQAIPCGLIVNELVTNAFKHAFPAERTGTIVVEMRADAGKPVELVVSDDGVGLPPGLDVQQAETLGLRVVNGLVRQIGGDWDVASQAGTVFRIRFPRKTEGIAPSA